MKRLLLAVVISSVLCVSAEAQSKFSIGPSAGYGWTSISNIDNSKFKAGANFGLSSVYSAAEHFGIGVDLKYSIEGAKFDLGNNQTGEIDLHYVRVPIKAIYFFNGYGSRVRPKLYAGPSLGFLSSAKENLPGQADRDIKAATNSFDFALTAGGGLNYRLVNKTWLNLDLSYMQGLTDLQKSVVVGDPSSHNRNVLLNVGVLFGL